MSVDPSRWDEAAGKQTGLPHVLAAASYSLAGFRRILAETAFRHELLFMATTLILFTAAGASAIGYVGQAVLFLILVAVEALNTAIEAVVDRISPEISDFARHAKDLGSFAVFCLLCANGAFALGVVAHAMLPG